MAARSPLPGAPVPRAVISEDAFAEALAEEAGPFLAEAQRLLDEVRPELGERHLFGYSRLAGDLETFLDDHGAAENLRFNGVRDAVAWVRWTALAASALVHLEGRLPSYPSADPAFVEETLLPDLARRRQQALEFLLNTTQVLAHQWIEAGIQWRAEPLADGLAPPVRWRLPANRPQDEIPAEEGGDRLVQFLGRFLRFHDSWEPGARRLVEPGPPQEEYMARYCTERIARVFEARAHNLQSDFDTWVAGSAEAKEHPELLTLRSAVSQALHLLEAATALSHLWERHRVQARDPHRRALFERTIDPADLLDVTVNGCAVRAFQALDAARPTAEELLDRLLGVGSAEFQLPEGLVLHARPLSLVVALVNHYGVPVQVEMGGEKADGASILSLLLLAGSHAGQRAIKVSGPQPFLEDFRLLLEARFGEDGFDGLPERLRSILGA